MNIINKVEWDIIIWKKKSNSTIIKLNLVISLEITIIFLINELQKEKKMSVRNKVIIIDQSIIVIILLIKK